MSDKDDITVVIKNQPSKEQGEQKVKELSEFLSQVWTMPLGENKA